MKPFTQRANVDPETEVFTNDRYQVIRRFDHGNGTQTMIHLSIKRLDKEPIHDWRDLQVIKNDLAGPETEAVELYPAESRLVDAANQFHLWCFPGFRFPFGFADRLVADPGGLGGTKQRPFEVAPPDLATAPAIQDKLEMAGYPKMLVGRLPGESDAELAARVRAIIAGAKR